MAQEKVRLFRLIEYTGSRAAVEMQVEMSIHGSRPGVGSGGRNPLHLSHDDDRCKITATTIGEFPEVDRAATLIPQVKELASSILGTSAGCACGSHDPEEFDERPELAFAEGTKDETILGGVHIEDCPYVYTIKLLKLIWEFEKG